MQVTMVSLFGYLLLLVDVFVTWNESYDRGTDILLLLYLPLLLPVAVVWSKLTDKRIEFYEDHVRLFSARGKPEEFPYSQVAAEWTTDVNRRPLCILSVKRSSGRTSRWRTRNMDINQLGTSLFLWLQMKLMAPPATSGAAPNPTHEARSPERTRVVAGVGNGDQLLIENVYEVVSAFQRRYSFKVFCDLHLTGDRLTVRFRPEWAEKYPKRYPNGLSIPYDRFVVIAGGPLAEPVAAGGQDYTHLLHLVYAKGRGLSRVFARRWVYFWVTEPQFNAFKELVTARSDITGRIAFSDRPLSI
jgi:hypothetical protein